MWWVTIQNHDQTIPGENDYRLAVLHTVHTGFKKCVNKNGYGTIQELGQP